MSARRSATAKQRAHIVAVCALAVAVFAVAYIYLQFVYAPPVKEPISFTLGNRTFNFTSYAVNITEDEKGLMNAAVMNSTFMLFEFHNSSIYQFWMKDTYSQLDIIWVYGNSSGGKIVYIVNATPCVDYSPNQTDCMIYTPSSTADYVIEAKAGFVQSNNVSLYEQVHFNYAGAGP